MGEGLFGVLPGGWEETTLGDVCRRGGGKIQTGPFGSQLHASDYVPVGVPTVMPANIGDNRIVEDGIARVSESDAQRLARHRLQLGDIVYSRRGDVERRALVRQHEVGWLCGTGSLLVRTGNKFADPVYLSLWLGHPQVRAWITQHAVGATMANLNTEILSDVPVVVPPIAEQRAIAGVLGALDDKIESNRRIADAAGALARMEFVRLVDDGTRPGRLGEVAELKYGKALAEGMRRPGPVAVFGSSGVTGWHDAAAVPGPVVVLGRKGRPGTTYLSFDDCWPIDTTFWLAPRQPVSLAWLYLAVERMDLGRFGADSAVPGLNREMAEADELGVPDETTMDAIQDLAWPLLTQVDRCGRESARLGALRDALLPELLSGRLRVREAEEMVGSV